MRAFTDGRIELNDYVRRHLDLCLDCRPCESACPSGVQYGQLIEPFKVAMQQSAKGENRTSLIQKLILHRLFPYSGRVKAALWPARILQKLGLMDLMDRVGMT